MRLELSVGLVLALGVACDSASGAASDTLQDDDIPMGGNDEDAGAGDGSPGDAGSNSADGSNPPGAGIGEPCDGTNQCDTGVCAAPFDSDPGELVCRTSCIALMDESMWCSDPAACCDANAICTPRGFCVAGEPAGDSEGDATEGTTGDSGGSSSESTGGGSSSSTDDGGGSSSSGG